MGRRKKEEPGYHRENISNAAEKLFLSKGITATTMDDIAKYAKYSKATLYVYFKSKEEIVGLLALKSMKKLNERISNAIDKSSDTIARYSAICRELVEYQEEYPFYFEMSLSKINVDFHNSNALPIEQDIFEEGELIIKKIADFMQVGIDEKILREDIKIPVMVFVFWASLSGIIITAKKKETYILNAMKLTKQQFLTAGFETMFRSISKEGVNICLA